MLVERFDIESYSDFSAKSSNFRGLVLRCIKADFCDQILILDCCTVVNFIADSTSLVMAEKTTVVICIVWRYFFWNHYWIRIAQHSVYYLLYTCWRNFNDYILGNAHYFSLQTIIYNQYRLIFFNISLTPSFFG